MQPGHFDPTHANGTVSSIDAGASFPVFQLYPIMAQMMALPPVRIYVSTRHIMYKYIVYSLQKEPVLYSH